MSPFIPLINIEGSRLLKDLPAKIEEGKIFTNQPISKTDMVKAKKALASLKTMSSNLTDLRESICALNGKQKEECTVQLETVVNVLMDAQQVIGDLEIEIEESNSKTIATSGNQCHEKKKQSVKLPTIDPPKFNGKITEFQEFWEAFESSIDNNTDLSEVQKFIYLKSLLSNPALNIMQGLSLTEGNYKIAKDLLKNRFGDKNVIINTHYASLRKIPRAENNTKSLRKTLDNVEKHLRCLEVLNENTRHNSLLSILYDKFPTEILIKIEERHDNVTMENLRQELNKIISSKERVENFAMNTVSSNNNVASTSTANFENRKIVCKFCEKEHFSDLCLTFKTLEQRKERTKNLCQICLRDGHESKTCNNTKSCFYCKKKKSHHQSLCPDKFGTTNFSQSAKGERETKRKEPASNPTATTTCLTQQRKKISSLTYAEVTMVGVGTEQSTLAVLDMGSDTSYITQEYIKKLKLKPEFYESLVIHQLRATSTEDTEVVTIKMKMPDKSIFELTANSVPDIPINAKNRLLAKNFCSKTPWNELHLADSGKFEKAHLLIGNDYLFDFVSLEKIEIQDNLYLIGSKLGWLIAGRTSSSSEVENASTAHCLLTNLGDSIKTIWSLDSIGINENPKVTDDDEALKKFYSQVTYDNDAYTVAWPWKNYPPELPTNYGIALGQLKSMITRLDENNLKKYDDIFRDQLQSKMIEKVDNDYTENTCHYLPHHGVFTPDKNTKLRIVFNGSAKTKRANLSLNECLIKGKVLLEDLAKILLRFRQYPIGIIADIEKAFLQINLHEKDRDAVRFLWIKDTSKKVTQDNIEIYRFTRVPFGVISSPFLLSITINYHLKRFPLLKGMGDDFYVDNLVTGVQNEGEAVNLYVNLKETLQKASMNIRQWKSNSRIVNDSIKEEDKEKDDVVSVLGLTWSTTDDAIAIKCPKLSVLDEPITKRKALQKTSAYFDPIGFFAPITLQGRKFIKTLWLKKLKWDQILDEKDQKSWDSILEDMRQIPEIKIPRYLGNIQEQCEIHCFTDASKDAYAAVVYIRANLAPNTIIQLAFAKTRVSPVEPVTIPRLELTAANIGTRAIKFVQEAYNKISFEKTYLWTDSKCVLYWLKSNKVLPIYVQRRVNEIKTLKAEFRYVPSSDNPADIASRGCTMDELQQSLWWTAPPWLYDDESHWPKNATILKEEIEEKLPKETQVLLTENEAANVELNPPLNIDMKRFSKLLKLLCTTAYALLAVRIFRKQHDADKTINLEEAEKLWLKYEQKSDQNLQTNAKNLQVHKDDAGIVRCDSRIVNADISFDEKYPILLSKNSYFTELLIMKKHEEVGHSGTSHTLAAVRQKYWIPQGRRIVYKVIKNKCFVCKKYNAKPFKPPQIAPLPRIRLEQNSTPFTNVGVDVFGPIFVRISINLKIPKEKRWVMIFTCLTVRAIHLEVLETMTSGEFLHAFRRFIARRGTPESVVTDNAPQFIVIQKAIQELWKTVTEDGHIQRYFAEKCITWKRIPQYAPWMGGAYERLIQITKNAIKRTYHHISLSNRQLVTVTAELEGIVNSRPLTYVGQEPDSMILTPNHFLTVKFPTFNINDIPTGETSAKDKIIKLWKKANEYLNQVWRNWEHHYLLSLRERNEKVKAQYRNTSRLPKIGEAVLIMDESHERGSWKIAIISNLIQSNDGEIRSVQLKTPSGNPTIRPITKIAPLELDIEENLAAKSQQVVAEQTPAPKQGENAQLNDDFDEIEEIECLSIDGDDD